MIVNQRMLDMDNQLAALTASIWALYEVVLGAGRGSALLPLCHDEARLHVDSLISEGFRHGALAALMSVGSHYNGVDFEVVGRGNALGRSVSDVGRDHSSSASIFRGVRFCRGLLGLFEWLICNGHVWFLCGGQAINAFFCHLVAFSLSFLFELECASSPLVPCS